MQKKYIMRCPAETGSGRCQSAEVRSAGFPGLSGFFFLVALSALCPVAAAASGGPEAAKSAPATTTVELNTLFFDFGNNLVHHPLIQTAVVVTNTGTTPLSLNPALTGSPGFSIVASKSCGAALAAGKSCDEVLEYNPKAPSYPKSQDAVLHLHFGNAAAGVPETVDITGVSAVLKPGTVTPTNNPQVALYTMTLPFPGRMKVSFGTTKSYGLRTWYRATQTNNGQVRIFVAGMKAKTTYHMIASVILGDRIYVSDPAGDQTFTTGAIPVHPVNYQEHVTVKTYGLNPQPGIEIANPLNGLAAFDLQGNQIWTYYAPTPTQDLLDGFKLLPNGNFLIVIGAGPGGAIGPIQEIREINLAGDTVRELSIADLNAALLTAPSSCKECTGLHVSTFHHDITPLPNGHVLVLTNTFEKLPPSKTGEPKTAIVNGDVIVDLDERWNPVWAWNEFNHLDPKRHPFSWPDWTHTNAVLYSPDDGNLLVSIRHQNWIVKVKYRDGSGDGSILWKLGAEGSFKLIGGSAPVDWFYAQHDPGFFSKNTSGVFSLGVMDNGDDRLYPKGSKCLPQGSQTLPAKCYYSTIPVYRIDENAMTATLTFQQKLPNAPENQPGKPFTSLYSFFGGNTEQLPNGDVEYDLCGLQVAPPASGGSPGSASVVQEVLQDSNDPKPVWTLELQNANFYRAFRMPSLYPGVQW
ncbi:MAG TPA: aryl-sulfate sulfotransferase [Terracidiphilus sp.]|nr:aryl-sulfate sulfotransferase [Terracidiphilus sp.]